MKDESVSKKEAHKIFDFRDLFAWQQGHEFVLIVYRLTKKFPQMEEFGLTSQLRRSAVSVTSCIAEGFSRNTFKDKYNFYRMAQASLSESQNQLIIAKDVGYIDDNDFKIAYNQAITSHKLLTGLCKSTRLRFEEKK
jgi:four helix bundle protein